MPLGNDTDGQMPFKTHIKYPTCARVFALVVTFFNGVGMGDYGNKHQGYIGIKKKV